MERVYVVIDKPANAWHCPFAEDDGFCVVLKGSCSACISEDPKHLFPDNCPLRPLPEKMDANTWHRAFNGSYEIRQAKGEGYNACIDELLREENEQN